jgi:hypothetical protein
MIKYSFLLIVVFLVFCTGCTPAVPPSVETVEPSETEKSTTEPETLTPTKAIIPVTLTTTQRPAFTLTSTQQLTETPLPKIDEYDFSKYGPLAYIDGTVEPMTIRMINPDGSRVEWRFESGQGYIINEIAWSPDGTQLALATTYDGITLLTIEDKGLINLSATNDFTINENPSFSPDGKFITFFAYNEGAIYRINVDGTGLVNLTPEASYRNSFESPAWSPSGETIVYSRRYADGSINSMNADGSAPRKLVDIGWNDQPHYSPDGRWLAFIRSHERQGFLYAMPADGGTYRLISGNDHDVFHFSWSPDGRFLVYQDYVCQGKCEFINRLVEFETGMSWELKTPKPAFGGLIWSPLMKTADTRQDCTDGWTQLAIGKLVQLVGEVPSRVRSAPQKGENAISQFVADETYFLLDGPVCADGLVWWEIADPRLPGGSGWTAEGDGQEYWLEPVN